MRMLCLFFVLTLALPVLPLLTAHNYNYTQAHELSLIGEAVFLPTQPIRQAQHPANIPTLLEYCQLRKYQLRDTEYRAEEMELTQDDQQLLFQMEFYGTQLSNIRLEGEQLFVTHSPSC